MLFYPREYLPPIYNYDPGYKQYQWGLVTALKLRIQELCFLSSHVSSGGNDLPSLHGLDPGLSAIRALPPDHPVLYAAFVVTWAWNYALNLSALSAICNHSHCCLLWQDEDFTLLHSFLPPTSFVRRYLLSKQLFTVHSSDYFHTHPATSANFFVVIRVTNKWLLFRGNFCPPFPSIEMLN